MGTGRLTFIDVQVGANIRDCRSDRALSQADLAFRVGLRPSDLADMESGLRRVSAAELFRLMQVLHIRPAEVYANLDRPWTF